MLAPFVLAMTLAQATPPPPVSIPPQRPLTAASQEVPEEPWPPMGVVRPGGGVTLPRLIKDVKPSYTGDAMRARIEGVVKLELVVEPDGTVGKVHVAVSLDDLYGLDKEAVRAVKQWRFVAGMKDGVAVPVLVNVEMSFTLKK